MLKNYTLRIVFSLFLICGSLATWGQQININTRTPASHPLTIPQTSTGYAVNNGSGAITFVLNNTNAFPAILDTVKYWFTTATGGPFTLWASTTSLSGNNGGQAASAATGWTQVATGTATIVANQMNSVLSGINYNIPGNTVVRFQLVGANIRYITAGASTNPDSFNNSGIGLMNGDYQINGQNVGYGQATFGFSPRGFDGQVNLTLQSTPCAGVPNHDTVIGNMNPCPGVSTCYFLTGNNPNSGLTYQWYSSTIGAMGPWNIMTNDTNSSLCLIPPQPGPTWYTCVVTCTASTQSDTATAIMVTPATFSPFSPCYCGNSSPTVVNLGDIGQFSIGTLSNPTVAPPLVTNPYVSNTYSNFDTLTPVPTFIQGQTYPVSMQAQFGPTFTYNGWTKAWIDYDHNTAWDPASEEILNSAANAPGFNANGTFTVPTTAVPGLTRLRIVYSMLGNQAGTQPCGTYTRGETEDYIVNILAAGPYDPAVTNIQVIPSSGCMDSNGTAILTIPNYGSQTLDLSTNNLVVKLNVSGPFGTTSYYDTLTVGLLQPFSNNSLPAVFTGLNLYDGGCYTINTDTLILLGAANTNLVNDSLFTAITVCNSRPNNGGDYTLCLGDTIPTGQGLSIANCPTGLVQDSVIIPFTLGFSGNIPPVPTSTAPVGSALFASGTLPNLRPGANILSGELSVTNLSLPAPSFVFSPSYVRFSLFNNPTAPPPLATINHGGIVGNPNLSAFGAFNYLSTPSPIDLNTMYTAGVPNVAAMNMGVWNTNYPTAFQNNAGVLANAVSPTVATLKIVYEYVPQGISWWDQPAGGTRIIDTSLFNPLITPNPIMSNSNALGTYTFYGACEADTNCRVAVNVIVGGLTYASVIDTAVQCNGDTTGSIVALVTGGTPSSQGYLYRLYQGPSIVDSNYVGYFGNLGAGTYRLNVLDSVGCSSGDSLITIAEPAPLVIDTALVTNVLCNGAMTGQLQVHAQGPAGVVYQNNLGPTQGTGTFTGLGAGTYTVRASHSNGACFVDTNLTITQPATVVSYASAASTNVSCNGLSDGSITVSGAGGTPGYNYRITLPVAIGPNMTGVFSGLPAGNHTVRITDTNGCVRDSIITITEPAVLTVSSASTTNVLCRGDSTGSIVMTYGGGTPGVTYGTPAPGNQIVPGTITDLPAGTYTVPGTDANGCTAVTTITITEPATNVSITSVTSTVPGCGLSNSTVTITAAGGTTPVYQYQFNGSAPVGSNVFLNQSAGTFPVVVTDGNGCTATSTHTISAPGAPTWNTVTGSDVSCNGGSDGSITFSATPGTDPTLAYNKIAPSPAPLQTNITSPLTGLGAGTYTIQVVDGNNCSVQTVVTINEPAVLAIDTASVVDVLCNGDATGTIVMNHTGGTGTPTYVMTVPPAGVMQTPAGTFINVPAGTYTITGTDVNNCTAITSVTVTEPNALSYTNVTSTNVSCNGAGDGTINAFGQGGVMPYGFTINPDPNAVGSINPGSFTGLGGNTYTVTLTDGNGCTLDSAVTITEPAVLAIDTASVTQVLCNGDSTGTIVMSSTGGNGIPTYVITSPTPVPPTILQAPAGTFNNVPAGVYIIEGTDGNGCTAVTTITITQPATAVQITNITGTTPSCNPGNDGTLTITASGGAGGLMYALLPGPQQMSSMFGGLPSGNFLAQVMDANGCVDTMNFTLANSNAPTWASVANTVTNCFGDSTGSITVQASNIPPSPLTYTITSPAGIAPPVGPTAGTATFNNLPAGTYTVEAVDANNCPVVTAVTVNQPTQVSIVSVVTDSVNCNGGSDGSIVVIGTGGTGPLSPSTPAGGVQSPVGTFTFSNLSAIAYTVQLQDGNGCTVDSMITIGEPSAVVMTSITSTDVLCNGDNTGGVIAIANGGTGTTKVYSINTMPVATNNFGLFGNLLAGNYIVTATDVNNCAVTAPITVNEPTVLGQSNVVTNVTCNGGSDGSITITGNGGVPPYINYTLYPIPPVSNNTGVFTGLPAGTMYQNVITDSNGCVDTSGMITITEPTQMVFTSVTKQDIECYGASTGSISVASNQGTGPHSYTISPDPNSVGTVGPSPQTFGNLPADIYTIVATDQNGCSISTTVTVIENPRIFFNSITNTEEKCFGDGDASITFQATGGVPPFVYLFDNQPPPSTQTTYTGLATGVYPIRAIDDLGCTHDTSYVLTGPDPITFSEFEIVPTTCLDTEDGKLNVTATGGRGSDYTYMLEPGVVPNTNGIFRDLKPRDYTLTVTDSAGCEVDTAITVPLPSNPLVVSVAKDDLGCHGRGNEGRATANVNGGTPPYTYLWSSTPVQTTSAAIGLYQGLHTVDVVDAQGCLVRDTFTIEPGPCCQDVFLPNAFSPNADGRNDEFRILSTAGMELKQFEVYNRWGVRIWQTNNVRQSWDGTYGGEPVDVGSYHYVLRYRCMTDGQNYTKKGDVTVIR